ncbi:MAG: FkbM family methyltransferase [Fibrobacteres bacterium]|nr:FkbM family methyltransferase [Fibrobacterota bacterium]
MSLVASDRATAKLLLREIFLEETYGPKLSREDPIIIDCGANCGFATAFFKLVHPKAQIIAIEPAPSTHRQLQQNARENNWQQVQLIQAACGYQRDFLDLIESNSTSLISSSNPLRSSGATVRVPVIEVSKLIAQFPRIDLIKLDVEGAEHDVMQDLMMTKSFVSVERLAIEYHHRMGDPSCRLGSFLQTLENCGFTYSLVAGETSGARFTNFFQDIMIYAYKKCL